jgi:hypothetical protein
MFSASGNSLASSMCDWNRLGSPALRRRAVSAIRGRRKLSTFLGWQWSVCRAISTLCFSARRWAASASTMAPNAASFTFKPDANSPPPVEIWMMPSDFLSANALRAPLMVTIDVTLMAA